MNNAIEMKYTPMNHHTANDQTREQINRNDRTDRHVLCLLADGDAETEAIHDRFAHTFDQHRGVGYGAYCHALRRLWAKGFERSYRTNNYPHGGFSTKTKGARNVYAITDTSREHLDSHETLSWQ